MPILRTSKNEYRKVETKKLKGITERKRDDADLAFGEEPHATRAYILDAHEWFDPHTSTKYSEAGVSRHAMIGPSFIVCQGDTHTTEYHVNDPKMWAWVRRMIDENLLTTDTMSQELVNNERELTFRN